MSQQAIISTGGKEFSVGADGEEVLLAWKDKMFRDGDALLAREDALALGLALVASGLGIATEEGRRSPAFDDALQNLGHALMTDDAPQTLVRVLTQFRDEYREEVLAESFAVHAQAGRYAILLELEERFREYARNAVMPEYSSAYSAVANELHKLAEETRQP